jgi:hypothetical protein
MLRGIGSIPLIRPSLISIEGRGGRGQRGRPTITTERGVWWVASSELGRWRRITVPVKHGWLSSPVFFKVAAAARRGWWRIIPNLPWRRRPAIFSRRVVITNISRRIPSWIITGRYVSGGVVTLNTIYEWRVIWPP